MLVTIGNNRLREELYRVAARIGYDFPNIIVPSAYISSHARIGKGCVVLNNAVVQNNAKIGNGVILNPGVEANHDSAIGNYCLIYTNSVVRSLTHVGDRVWIGSTATVVTSAFVPDDEIINFSLLIETVQFITARGCFDLDDVVLNAIGTAAGYGLWLLFTEKQGIWRSSARNVSYLKLPTCQSRVSPVITGN